MRRTAVAAKPPAVGLPLRAGTWCKPSPRQSRIRQSVRIFPKNGFSASLLLVALAGAAGATPIQPDLNKLLSKPHSEQEWFEPARAGWEGPETEASSPTRSSSALDEYGPAESARAARASFLAAVPDPRVRACLGALVLLLRNRQRATPKPAGASHPDTVEVRRTA